MIKKMSLGILAVGMAATPLLADHVGTTFAVRELVQASQQLDAEVRYSPLQYQVKTTVSRFNYDVDTYGRCMSYNGFRGNDLSPLSANLNAADMRDGHDRDHGGGFPGPGHGGGFPGPGHGGGFPGPGHGGGFPGPGHGGGFPGPGHGGGFPGPGHGGGFPGPGHGGGFPGPNIGACRYDLDQVRRSLYEVDRYISSGGCHDFPRVLNAFIRVKRALDRVLAC